MCWNMKFLLENIVEERRIRTRIVVFGCVAFKFSWKSWNVELILEIIVEEEEEEEEELRCLAAELWSLVGNMCWNVKFLLESINCGRKWLEICGLSSSQTPATLRWSIIYCFFLFFFQTVGHWLASSGSHDGFIPRLIRRRRCYFNCQGFALDTTFDVKVLVDLHSEWKLLHGGETKTRMRGRQVWDVEDDESY